MTKKVKIEREPIKIRKGLNVQIGEDGKVKILVKKNTKNLLN